MQLVKVTKNYQITLPARLRRNITLKEGDYLAADIKNGSFVFRPAAAGSARDPDQEWFWSAAWQKKEREADADIHAGRTRSFSSMQDLVAELRAQSA
jgi:AbrB family looped-hinge helix DNA binding protein